MDEVDEEDVQGPTRPPRPRPESKAFAPLKRAAIKMAIKCADIRCARAPHARDILIVLTIDAPLIKRW